MKLKRFWPFVGCVLLTIRVWAQSTEQRPNVILIYSDDQGWADLHSFGSNDLYTPVLDSLGASGVRFTQFYAASPICSPSRASLLTGRYPQRAGLPEMASSLKGVEGMPGNQYTMGELFRDAGYKTAHIGKWHVGYTPETMPNAQGFDYSFGFMGGCIDNYSHFFYWNGPNRHDLWRNGTEIHEDGAYFPDLMVREAGAFMEKNRNDPFFIYFAINVPHYPLQGEKKWLDYYREKGLASPRAQYAAFVSTMDEKIGMLLNRLKALGLTDNTIVIFQPDQGFSEEERTFGGGGSAGILRGSKFSLFEGGTRVPAIISWSKHIASNQVRDQFAANIDWLPTLAAYCNLSLPGRKLDGKSLVHIIRDDRTPTRHKTFFWKQGGTKEKPQWAVRRGDWKLLHNPVQARKEELDQDGFFLANIKADPAEKSNLSKQQPGIVNELKALYDQWVVEVDQQ
ncbi:sulfatase-like hydrolase/transferase [Niabella beijingensis]|uniref:sulfatase-like hydrolase/transferase n=1 Tax=Niabella beijingensis TaxID=2872700 RepID=UPI001CBEFBFE|nr:sulfatase-like hydrolase/transferase [Niabella beijingensis]MBZ4190165.1 sulfatase-like hydrolase/transferase [Niabella beijingensis]